MTPNLLTLFADSIIFWEDNDKVKIVKEIFENFVIAINNKNPSLRKINVLRFIEILAKIKIDSLTNQHLMDMLDFYYEETDEIRFNQGFIGIFSIFKRIKFNDVNYIEKCFYTVLNSIKFCSVDEHTINFKNIINSHLPKVFMQKVQNVIEEFALDMINKNLKNPAILINHLAKVSLFNCNEELIEKVVKKYTDFIKENYSINNIFIENYISIGQKHLKDNHRDLIVTEILEKIKLAENGNCRLYILLSECKISKNNEALSKKMKETLELIAGDIKFQNNFFRFFESETNKTLEKKNSIITNLSFSKYVNLLKKFTKEDDFLKFIKENLIINVFNTATNLLIENKYEANTNARISEDLIISLLKIIDNVLEANPEFLPNILFGKLAYYLKIFNSENIDNPIFEKLSIITLKNTIRKSDKISFDFIICLDKVFNGEISEEKIKIFNKIFENEEKIKFQFSIGNQNFLLKLYYKMNLMDNKNLITDEIIFWAKDNMIEKLKNDRLNIDLKLFSLFSLAILQPRFINENDVNKILPIIKTIFKEYSLKRIIGLMNNIPVNNKNGTISKIILNEISNIYEKNPANKFIAIKMLEKFSNIRWPYLGVFNKFISDYNELADNFSDIELSEIIYYMSKNNINHFDIIENVLSNIKNFTRLNDNDKFNLLLSLINLGMYKNSKIANEIIIQILENLDNNYTYKKMSIVKRVEFLFELNRLERNGYNVKEFVNIFF